MSQVYVQTLECYRKQGYIDETERQFIRADQLVDVLNSAAQEGPDRHYIVVGEDFKIGV